MEDEVNTPPDGTFAQLMEVNKQSAARSERANARTNDQTKKQIKKPTNVVSKVSTNQSTNVSGNDRSARQQAESRAYRIEIPSHRVKRRASFDVFDDQKTALSKLQLAAVDAGYERPKLGEMIQESIDLYVRRKAKEFGNVAVRKQAPERTNER